MDNIASRSSAVPTWDLSGLTIVDVGCGDGWRFDLPQFTTARRLIGVECDTANLQAGRHRAERVKFVEGVAERLPLGDGEVDAYLSFVALPYTDIPAAVKEAYRVLRPGGRLQVSLHDWRHQLSWFMTALRELAIRRVLDHAYIVTHSTWLAWTGRCFGRPWNRDRLESFQTQARTRLLFTAAGFTNVKCYRTARHLVVEAFKPIDAG